MTFKVSSKQTTSSALRKERKRRIYLKESHDYFDKKYVRKMQERQRKLSTEGILSPTQLELRSENRKPVNGIVPSKYWRAYDLHNKPRGLYSEEEKKLVALDDAFYDRKSVTVSNNKKLGSTLRRILGSSMKKRRIESEPLMMTYPSHFIHEGRHRTYSSVSDTYSSCSSIRTRSSSESSTDSQTSSSSGSSCCGSRKQVHFAPETVFCERNPKSSFWRDFLEKRRAKAIEEAQKEEMLRPRPFLPYLESGLSYHDDEEFYRLKYSDDHRNAQLRMMQRTYESRKKNGGSCRQVFLKALRTVFCCGANTEFTERSLKKVHGGHGPSKQRV